MGRKGLSNTLSRDNNEKISQFSAFRGAKHFSPNTVNGVKELISGATDFSRTWLVVRNPSKNAASIWIGYEDDVTSADTNRQGWEMAPGESAAYAVGTDIHVYAYCSVVQRINCQELG